MFYQSTPWLRYSIGVIASILLVHFIFGFILGLSVDEAHYALYGLHPDWSYFDHPPLVGWLQILPAQLHWADGWMRLVPEFIWFLSLLLNIQVCQYILKNQHNSFSFTSPKPAIFWTICISCLSPILHVLGVALLPDTILLILVPAMVLATLSLHHELSERHPRDLFQWIILGLILGFSGLSKYTSIFFAICIPLCLISWHGLKIFRRPGLYLCLLIALVLISPILYWNFKHEWISFKYQFGHGTGGEWHIKRVLVFFLNQIVSYGLLIPLGMIWFLKTRSKETNLIFSFFLVPLLIFAYFSGGGGSLPHWTAPAWVALIPFAGIGIANAFDLHRKLLIRMLIGLQVFICSIGFILLFCGGIPGISMNHELGKKNPIADLYGWQEAGEKIQQFANEYQIKHLAVQNWTLASRLAWYAKPLPVYVLDDRYDQFDLWFGKLEIGSDVILVDWSQMSFINPVSEEGFESCDRIESQMVKRLDRDIAQFDFYLCKNWQGHSTPKRTP